MTTKIKNLKIFDVYCDVYGTNLLVIIGMPREKLRPFIEKKYKIDWNYTENNAELKAGGYFEFDKWPYQVIWLRNKLPKEDLIPKISHEVLHHIGRLCVAKGIPTYPEIDNLTMDEPKCYLMEFYMREILKKI